VLIVEIERFIGNTGIIQSLYKLIQYANLVILQEVQRWDIRPLKGKTLNGHNGAKERPVDEIPNLLRISA
jgi:hypothetical protein